MIKRLLTGLLIVFSAAMAEAQVFSIKRLEQTPDGLTIYYDLIGGESTRTYLVQVYSSTDNYAKPLMRVSGDVGIDVKSGLNRKIFWNAKAELGESFSGNVQLEIRGRVYVPFISFLNTTPSVVKRTKATEFEWSTKQQEGKLSFRLFQGTEQIAVLHNIDNKGRGHIKIPGHVKPGMGYYFVVSDTRDPAMVVRTDEFQVVRRLPMWAKFAPIAVVAGAAIIILPKGADSDEVGEPFGPPSGKN